MIHAALFASLIAGGIGTTGSRPDTAAHSLTPTDSLDTPATTSGLDPCTTATAGSLAAHAPTPPESGRAVVGPRIWPSGFARGVETGSSEEADGLPAADTVQHRSTRPRAIEYSDWYYRRLTIHRIGSYVELPLFAAEYVLGERLLHDERHGFPPSGLRTAHVAVAGGLGILFATNTVTGAWNLWAGRKDPTGRPRRFLHAALMLASDFGFLATGASGGGAKHSLSNAQLHQSLAEASMGVAVAGTAMMWLWRN